MKLIFILVLGFSNLASTQSSSEIKGTWQLQGAGDPGERAVMIVTERYLSIAVFNELDHSFVRTYGGSYRTGTDQLFLNLEYDSKDTTLIGTELQFKMEITAASLTLTKEAKVTWTRLNTSESALTGCWRITSRIGSDGSMAPMPQGPRKTLKLISGDRFQWVAINPATKQFSGTGGGTFKWMDGKYTETIEFFSRDKSRAGSQLSFNAKINGTTWEHQGSSSTGNPVHEIWMKQ